MGNARRAWEIDARQPIWVILKHAARLLGDVVVRLPVDTPRLLIVSAQDDLVAASYTLCETEHWRHMGHRPDATDEG